MCDPVRVTGWRQVPFFFHPLVARDSHSFTCLDCGLLLNMIAIELFLIGERIARVMHHLNLGRTSRPVSFLNSYISLPTFPGVQFFFKVID